MSIASLQTEHRWQELFDLPVEPSGMRPTRSALFIPGNKPGWMDTASKHSADVVILDLEDAVPPAGKMTARDDVTAAVSDLRADDQRTVIRVNGHPNTDTDLFEKDVERVVPAAPEALLVPKLRQPADVQKVDTVLTHIETREGMTTGTVELVVIIETIHGMKNAHELCDASDRVTSVTCGAVKGTDTERALRFEWTGPGREGLETLHMREKVLLDARAAGVRHPLAGPYVDIDDTTGLLEDIEFAKQMGYGGYIAIHPSQVPHANEAFTPDESEIKYWLGLYETLTEAIEEENRSTARYCGEMVDTANLRTAAEFLHHVKTLDHEFAVEIPDDI